MVATLFAGVFFGTGVRWAACLPVAGLEAVLRAAAFPAAGLLAAACLGAVEPVFLDATAPVVFLAGAGFVAAGPEAAFLAMPFVGVAFVATVFLGAVFFAAVLLGAVFPMGVARAAALAAGCRAAVLPAAVLVAAAGLRAGGEELRADALAAGLVAGVAFFDAAAFLLSAAGVDAWVVLVAGFADTDFRTGVAILGSSTDKGSGGGGIPGGLPHPVDNTACIQPR